MDLPRIKPLTVAMGAAFALLGTIVCHWLWNADRQIRVHNAKLLKAVGDRNFDRVSQLLAPDYSDPWNESGDVAVERLREVIRQYFSVTLREEVMRVELKDRIGIVTARVRLDGRGTAFAESVTRRVNGLAEPFVFHWRKESWQPWDWRLVHVQNPDLSWNGSGGFLE